ncbi:hypothetical protein ACEPPZ_14405 [Paracoccus yeei]|uniref:hypothetical protein n=1 Tax=Paracoccus yeei TaxID=147645 RepID=UPI0028D3A4F5|nr:hypothetical protein [Paracoccus yeei]
MNIQSNEPRSLIDSSLHVIRDMILLALDATETPNLPEANRLEARAALAEALDVLDGGAK